MKYPVASDVQVRDILSTRWGLVYVAALVGVIVTTYQFVEFLSSNATESAAPAWLTVFLLIFLLLNFVAVYQLSRRHMLWAVSRTGSLVLISLSAMIVSMMILDISTSAGINQSPFLRTLGAVFTGFLFAEITAIGAFLATLAIHGTGGDGESPEEQVLGDDLDL